MNTSELMLQSLERNWGWLFFRGVLAIVFGVLAFAWPGITLITLAILFGAYVLADGVFALIAALTKKERPAPTGWLVMIGILGIAAGLAAFFWPGLTAVVLVIMIGTWAIVRGIFEIMGAIMLRKVIHHEWLLIVSGVVSVLFGLMVWFHPGAGALAIIWYIAAYSILFGALMISFALKLKHHRLQTT